MRAEPKTVRLESFEDVVGVILPIAPTMTERDVADLILTIHSDPTSGPEMLAAYQAADARVPPSAWATVWSVLQAAAGVASVITSIASAAALVP